MKIGVMMLKRVLILVVLLLSFPFTASSADSILTISGQTDRTANGPVQFTLEEFEAIGMSDVVTKTPWHKETTTFSGISGKALIQYLGAIGTEIEAIALNDYKVTIPVSDLMESGVILATRANDQAMSIRDKGPIFFVYPFDANPDLNNEVIYGRSIWQVKELVFR